MGFGFYEKLGHLVEDSAYLLKKMQVLPTYMPL